MGFSGGLIRTVAAAAGVVAVGCAGGVRGRSSSPPPAPETPSAAIARVAERIRVADYEGDRPRLAALSKELEPYAEGPLSSRARYWRGFALWRRASNGEDEKAPPAEIMDDLRGALEEFQGAAAADPRFAEARVGQAACIGELALLGPASERMTRYRQEWDLLREARKTSPENPRLAWALGTAQWRSPVQIGGGREKSVETYHEGLDWARHERVADAADPSWGEPELLRSLAFVSLNATPPDLEAAEHYAQEALALVPNWRSVRDVLIPQIEAARRKSL